MTSISSTSLASNLFQQMSKNIFSKIDSDSSGKISLEEFKAGAPKDSNGNTITPPTGAARASVEDAFAKLDTNSDGSLSEDEFATAAPPPPGGSGTSQGLLSSDSIASLLSSLSEEDAQSFLTAADTDGDSEISVDELNTAIEDILSQISAPDDSVLAQGFEGAQGQSGPRGAGGPPPGGGAKGSEGDDSATLGDSLDTNGDGVVSIEELLAAEDDDSSTTSASGTDLAALQNAFRSYLLSAQEA